MGLIARLLGAKDHPKLDPCVFVLRVQRTNGRKTCLVEARSDQTFAELDLTIRRSLGYDTWDHCSGFFEGDPWESTLLCEVYPDGSGPGEKLPLEMLSHKKIAECGWVYDFGDNPLPHRHHRRHRDDRPCQAVPASRASSKTSLSKQVEKVTGGHQVTLKNRYSQVPKITFDKES
jgi:hypothetical protein